MIRPLFICFILLSTLVRGQSVDSLAKNIIPDSSKVTISKVYNDVLAGMQGLGTALKVGAEHVYVVVVKQQVVKAITNLVWSTLLIILIIFVNIIVLKNRWYTKYTIEYTNGASIFVPILVSIILFIAFCIVFDPELIITGFTNPEYGAIKDIINFVK